MTEKYVCVLCLCSLSVFHCIVSCVAVPWCRSTFHPAVWRTGWKETSTTYSAHGQHWTKTSWNIDVSLNVFNNWAERMRVSSVSHSAGPEFDPSSLHAAVSLLMWQTNQTKWLISYQAFRQGRLVDLTCTQLVTTYTCIQMKCYHGSSGVTFLSFACRSVSCASVGAANITQLNAYMLNMTSQNCLGIAYFCSMLHMPQV